MTSVPRVEADTTNRATKRDWVDGGSRTVTEPPVYEACGPERECWQVMDPLERFAPPKQRATLLRRVVAAGRLICGLLLLGAAGICVAAGLAPVSGPLTDVQQRDVLAQIAHVGRRGFLYEVTRPAPDGALAGKRLFLYGTIHLGRIGSEPFNAPVVNALRQSRRLALEADPSDDDATQKLALQLGRYGEGDGLQLHLSGDLMARVRAFGAKNGYADEQLARFRPWLLANMVTLRDFGDAGLDPALGSELYLGGFARARHLPIVEIEGLEVQFRLLAALPDALQAAQLDEALSEVDDHEVANEGKALFDVWLTGDAAAAEAMVAELHRDDAGKAFGRYFVETLIDQRDRTMADKAESYFALPGNTFFAVGTLHLFGPAGLIQELTRRGYRIVDLQAPLVVDR